MHFLKQPTCAQRTKKIIINHYHTSALFRISKPKVTIIASKKKKPATNPLTLNKKALILQGNIIKISISNIKNNIQIKKK